MKVLLILLASFALALAASAQGIFLFQNTSAPTYIGSLDGQLASTNICAQMLAGPTADSLVPVGIARRHGMNGFVGGLVNTVVPNVPAFTSAYVQMVAWDSLLWGTSLNGVPLDQLGRTDIVTVYLTDGGSFPPTIAPHFNQSAIVPVPEPAGWALVALAGSAALLAGRRPRPRSDSP
jgi:hypothetical protein